MAYPNITDRNLSAGFQEVLFYVNEVTNDWFFRLVLVGIWVIIFSGIYVSKRDAISGIAVASFVVLVFTTIMWFAGITSSVTLLVTVAVAIVGFALLLVDESR